MDVLPDLRRGLRPFLGAGGWTLGASRGEGARAIEDPSQPGTTVATVAEASTSDVDDAVEAARTAWTRWRAVAPAERAAFLAGVAALLRERAEAIGELLAREEGKLLAEGIGEARRAADLFAYYAHHPFQPRGEALDGARGGVEIVAERRPLGTVALITPWNFPIAIPAWKLAPALAYGNVAILKPGEQAPLSALALSKAVEDAGAPPGVVQVLTGGGEVGRALVEHPGVDGISFTGSLAVGRSVAAAAADRLVPCQLELGGKNALVVLDDADLEVAVACAVQGAFGSTGQRCTASSRIVVTPGIRDRFVRALAERTAALTPGPALDPASDYGPVIDEAQLRADLEAIEAAERAGAVAAVRGEVAGGRLLGPTLFVDTASDLPLNQEEAFGPIACVIPAADVDEAIALANATRYGLVAGVVTTSLRHAARFRAEVEAGMVMVNLPTAGQDLHAPFGGAKASSFGPKEQGVYAREFYTTVRTSYLRPAP
jgi:aldehyde dehydrogenase (NAD+)